MDVPSLVALGEDLHRAGDLKQACLVYAKALKAAPNDTSALVLMGVAQQQLGQHDRALNFLGRALKRVPSHAQALFHQALSFAHQHQWASAIDAYQRIIALQPNHFEAHCNLGNAQMRVGQADAAMETYQRALAIRDDSPVLHYNLGVLCQAQMRPQAAIDAYRAAIALKPSYAAAYSNLSVALCEVGRVDEGRAANELALKLDPNSAESHFNAHTHALNSGNPDQAIECLRRACDLAPDDQKFHFFLGMLLDEAGDDSAALSHWAVKSPSPSFRSDIEAWGYLKSLTPRPRMLGNAAAVFALAMTRARTDGLVLEFGVYQGTSIRQIAALTESTVHGFDSFVGIPQAWNDEQAGSYSTHGQLPPVPSNVQLHVGWFEDSLAPFIQTHSEPVRFINIDCDLYSSTKTVLDLLQGQIGAGTVLVFDEFIGNRSWRDDEFKAFHEAAQQYHWRFEVFAYCFVTKQVAIQILEP